MGRALLWSGDSILLGLRKETGLWECPGGKVDEETVLEATLREAREETGLDLDPCLAQFLGYADAVSVKDARKRSIDIFHAWELSEPHPVSPMEKSHARWEWFGREWLESVSRHAMMPSTHYCLTFLFKGHFLRRKSD